MLHYAYNAYLVKIKVHKLSKKLGVTSQFLEPEDWYEAKSMLRVHKLRATLQNPVATAIWRPGFVQPRVETRMLMSGRILNTCSQKNSDLKSHYTWVSKK
jgi:hypothetical protein